MTGGLVSGRSFGGFTTGGFEGFLDPDLLLELDWDAWAYCVRPSSDVTWPSSLTTSFFAASAPVAKAARPRRPRREAMVVLSMMQPFPWTCDRAKTALESNSNMQQSRANCK